MIFLNAYCLAASEENAAGGIVVTAPTSGVILGLTCLAKYHFHYDRATLRAGRLAAAVIGCLVKQNASISGAEMGCIGSYVQIPCIERNAMGAVKAYNAFLLATSEAASLQKTSLDSVIKVMKATGRDISTKYKETSKARLAISATEC